jgi:hypothetical protein
MVDYSIGLLYRPASLRSLASRYDKPYARVDFIPPVRDYEFGYCRQPLELRCLLFSIWEEIKLGRIVEYTGSQSFCPVVRIAWFTHPIARNPLGSKEENILACWGGVWGPNSD